MTTIPHMRTLFGCEIGLSDHTMGVGAAVAAVAHGASVVENISPCVGPMADRTARSPLNRRSWHCW